MESLCVVIFKRRSRERSRVWASVKIRLVLWNASIGSRSTIGRKFCWTFPFLFCFPFKQTHFIRALRAGVWCERILQTRRCADFIGEWILYLCSHVIVYYILFGSIIKSNYLVALFLHFDPDTLSPVSNFFRVSPKSISLPGKIWDAL